MAGTSADFLKEDRFNGAYRHGIYQSGYNYYRRIIGHGLDNDAYVYSAGFVVVNDTGNAWQVVGRVGDLNRGGGTDEQHSVSTEPADLASIDIQYSFLTRFGTFDIGAGFERREVVATGEETSDTRGFLSWRYDWGR
jgi:hypothetical protein